ncbi:MAG: indole-3-glycerol phosphate synthase TrpC [Alphaproteobacteria bacterium]|nr:indole-3-glycerol phosphate synthase TrpC [Alphaproteobacteria bacterium]
MSNLLQKICADKLAAVIAAKKHKAHTTLEDEARTAPKVRDFSGALARKTGAGGYAVIAEIKKASPSAGLIQPHFIPAALAQAYAAGGAACLSVLTDQPYFCGEDLHLIQARAACDLPVLRKDFMLDPYQVIEARAIGADCILLIMAAIGDAQASELYAAAQQYGMDVLIESHNAAELERALKLPGGLIGINNRNLGTLAIDLATTENLAKQIPTGRTIISESGLHNRADLDRMATAGARCFLIGESLLKQGDVTAGLRRLLA